MLWTNIRKWAKDRGYSVTKEKTPTSNQNNEDNENDEDNEEVVVYRYVKDTEKDIYGSCTSLTKLVKAIFNLETNNKFVDYQNSYVKPTNYNTF